MAVSKITDWFGIHKLGDDLIFIAHYDVYADVGNASTTPYVRITDCEVCTMQYKDDRSLIQSALPMTFELQIDNDGTVYTMPVNGTIYHHDGTTWDLDHSQYFDAYYYVRFSSSTNIVIPKDGQEFAINISLSTAAQKAAQNSLIELQNELDIKEDRIDELKQLQTDGSITEEQEEELGSLQAEVVTIQERIYQLIEDAKAFNIVEHAAGPMANSISGPTSIYTGTPSIYKLNRSFHCSSDKRVTGSMEVYFPPTGGNQYVWTRFPGYSDPYTEAESATTDVSTIAFVPLRKWAAPGTVSTAENGCNKFSIHFVYNNNYNDLFAYSTTDGIGLVTSERVRVLNTLYFSFCQNHYSTTPFLPLFRTRLTLTYFTKAMKVTARSEIDPILKAEFESFNYLNSHGLVSEYNGLDRHIEKYGAGIQNQTHYYGTIKYRTKYGNELISETIDDYKNGTRYDGIVYHDTYDGGMMTAAVQNATVTYSHTDSLGFAYSYVDSVNVLAYSDPVITVTGARRCSRVDTSTGPDCYEYDSKIYKIDDNGDYVLIEWGVEITPINGINSRRLTIVEPRSDGKPGVTERSISLPTYSETGYYVTYANPDYSYEIEYILEDDFHIKNGGHGYIPVTKIVLLNTSICAIDFLCGGAGLAFGKVAEMDHTVDFHRNWTINMPYETLVMNYNSGGTPVRLYDWMASIDSRIKAIINNRGMVIYDGVLHDGNTAACIPSGYGTVSTQGTIDMSIKTNNVTAGLLIGDAITASRSYLYLDISGISFIREGRGVFDGTLPTIYIMGSKPTSINQSTGAPNGTILATVPVQGSIEEVGAVDDGYMFMHIYPYSGAYNYIDITSFRGRSLWIVITARSDGTHQSDNYQFHNNTGITVFSIIQTNKRT